MADQYPDMKGFEIGVIGMGDMGKMYAKNFSEAGWRVNACDREENYESLKAELVKHTNINVLTNGHRVSRASDYIIYSVEAEMIDRVVANYGQSTRQGAIVGGQTSCKTPEIAAFEKHLPQDVEIVSCHSLHGPKIDPRGQPLVIVTHPRASQESIQRVKRVLSCLGSQAVELTAQEHDRITADTQAVTHAAFLSMGTAWQANAQFPWEMNRYVGGIENVKINLTLRIYSSKWHVYAGLAILNPSAKEQIRQYATSVSELFKLMIHGKREEFEQRVKKAGAEVFKPGRGEELLLREDVLNQFSLGEVPKERRANSHLSLLAMVDCWWKLGSVPYDHMICSTPLFRLWLGVTQYLFRKPDLLDEVIRVAIDDNSFRQDDLEFMVAARGWSDCVSFGNFDSYRDRFERIQKFFEPRFSDATRVGNEMIKTILQSTASNDMGAANKEVNGNV
ncbi:MAG: prephenate dehydrogenase (NADP(+)) [Candelaria pacifica]|nr:MAG: prephenate dehydrogenase (NADP(+)) [Candelaria pacifica]